MSRLFDDDDSEGQDEISNQPYLLQIDINYGKNIPKAGLTSSDPYLLVRFGKLEVARTEVVKWTVNPVWNSSFTIPLLHIQHHIFLEIWDSKSYDKDEILGKVTVDLQELGNNTLLEKDFVVEQAGRKHASGYLCCGLYLEKRKHLISISHLPTNTTHSDKIEQIHSSTLSAMLKQEYQQLKSLPSVQEAIEKSDLLKQKDFNFSYFRDVLCDLHSLTSADSDNASYIDGIDNRHTRGSDSDWEFGPLPMTLHRFGDDIHYKNPVRYSKSTRINLSSGDIESFVCPYSKYGRHVLVLEIEDAESVVMVAPNQFMVWAWIRIIRRSIVRYHLKEKASSGASFGITVGDLYEKNHVCGLACGDNDGDAVCEKDSFSCHMDIVLNEQTVQCLCRFDAAQVLLTCDIGEGKCPALIFSLIQLKSICIPLDYAECNELLFRFDVISAKLVLSRATRESSFYNKSTFEQLKQEMTVISSFATHMVVNFLDGRELVTPSLEGISPFWNTSSTFGVHSQSFSAAEEQEVKEVVKKDIENDEEDCGAAANMDRLGGILVHMLTGEKGYEKVLGSKLLLFADLFNDDFAHSLASSSSNQTNSIRKETDMKSTFITLDMNLGLRLEILQGENLVPSKELLSSSFLDLFIGKAESEEMVFDPRVEVSCIRYGQDPSQNTYKKYTTQAKFQTANPVWNETIIVNTVDGLHSAHLVQLVVKDHDSGCNMGVVYIPIAEFFTHRLIKGGSRLKKYPVLPPNGLLPKSSRANSCTHNRPCQLGHLTVRLQLIQEGRHCTTSVLEGIKISPSNMNVIPIEAEFKTQLKSSNVHTSFFVCECVTTTSLRHVRKEEDKRIERFALAPGYDSLVLMPFANYYQQSEMDSKTNTSLESALLHQFKRHTRRKKRVQSKNTGPDDEEWEEIIVFYFYENQRSAGLLNFSADYLSSLDRENFTDETGYFHSPYSPDDVVFKPPEGYIWDVQHNQKWTIDYDYTETDKKGWSYGIDFNHLMQRLRRGHSTTNKFLHNVRRRRWQRIAVLKDQDVLTPRKKEMPPFFSVAATTASVSPPALGDNQKRFKYGSLSRSFGAQHLGDKSVVFTLFHNQRRGISRSWSADNLLLFERPKYSNENGSKKYDVEDLKDLPPLVGYQWAEGSTWEVDKTYTPTDRDGWVYGLDFPSIESNLQENISNTSKRLYACRRQKLNRMMVEEDGPSLISISRDQKLQLDNQFSKISRSTTSESISLPAPLSDVREEGFATDRESVLRFCEERETETGPVCVPWQQVKHIDVITPSVLSVIVTINRYVGNQKFAPVDVEMFVYECPAEQLCLLMRDRMQLLPFRQDVFRLITSGTLTGNDEVTYSYRSASSDDITTTTLSLGSIIFKNLLYEIEDIESARHNKHVIVTGNTENMVVTAWAKQEMAHLKALKHRLMLYGQLLLASDLRGPDFNEHTAARVVRADQQIAQLLLSREYPDVQSDNDDENDNLVGRTKRAVTFLLSSAESRICDYALTGWEHQGRKFEGIMSTLINGYFFSMIEILGCFFDSEEVLQSVAGNGDKLALINFILEHDSTLSMVIDSSLRPYELKVSPQPLFSYSLNIKTLLEWYVVNLKIEIMTYVSRTFDLNYKDSSVQNPTLDSKFEYALPWDVLNDQGLMLSSIPLDVAMLLKSYFDLLGKADKPNMSLRMRAGLSFLYRKIRLFQIESFIFLIEKYHGVLVKHDWTSPKLPNNKQGAINSKFVFSDEMIFTSMSEHLLWLSSIGNDVIKLQTRTINFNDRQCHYSQELITELNHFYDLSMSALFIAMDYMSCIIYKSFESFLPLTHIRQKWLSGIQTENLIKRVVGELLWYLDSNEEHLFPLCFWVLSHICLSKFTVWYFSFLDECYTSKIPLTLDDIAHIALDCDYIYETFAAKILQIPRPEPPLQKQKEKETQRQRQRKREKVSDAYNDNDIGIVSDNFILPEANSLHALLQRFLQIKLMLTALPDSSQLNELLASLLKECDECVDKRHASALAQMIHVVFQLRNKANQQFAQGVVAEAGQEEEENENHANAEWFALKIDMLIVSMANTVLVDTTDATTNRGILGLDSSPEEWVWGNISISVGGGNRGSRRRSTGGNDCHIIRWESGAARTALLSDVLIKSAPLRQGEKKKQINCKRKSVSFLNEKSTW